MSLDYSDNCLDIDTIFLNTLRWLVPNLVIWSKLLVIDKLNLNNKQLQHRLNCESIKTEHFDEVYYT